MSGDGFHVHGPHDHHLEHAAHGGDSFTSRIAVITAVLSTIGAIFGYMGGHTQNAALLYKNEAAIHKTAASDQWNFYQAKSSKQSLAELGATLANGEDKAKFAQSASHYADEKEKIKAAAEKLEAQAEEADHEANAEMHVHQRWALATTLIQIGIALSAIALLTRRRWMLWGVYAASSLGLLAGTMGYLNL